MTTHKATPENYQSVCRWQSMGYVHPLTCGDEDCGAYLLPDCGPKGVLQLVCPSCGHIQEHVPDVVLAHNGWPDPDTVLPPDNDTRAALAAKWHTEISQRAGPHVGVILIVSDKPQEDGATHVHLESDVPELLCRMILLRAIFGEAAREAQQQADAEAKNDDA